MTFSIVGLDPEGGQIGVAVTSSSIAVAGGCAFARAGVGAGVTQNVVDPSLGPALLDDIARGLDGPAALAQRMVLTAQRDYCQLAVLDRDGRGAFFSGAETPGPYGGMVGVNCVAVGHGLADDGVPAALIEGFLGTEGALAGRLIAALDAGLQAGGGEANLKSASVLVAVGAGQPDIDLRVDLDDDPILALAHLWGAHLNQAGAGPQA